jgi:hypothetical protein
MLLLLEEPHKLILSTLHKVNIHSQELIGRWPKKSCQHIVELLENLKANAEAKGLDLKKTYITHSQVNKAPKGRRRSFKAHGRIKDWCSSNCHVELFVTEKEENVKKAPEKKVPKITKKQMARRRLRVGKAPAVKPAEPKVEPAKKTEEVKA